LVFLKEILLENTGLLTLSLAPNAARAKETAQLEQYSCKNRKAADAYGIPSVEGKIRMMDVAKPIIAVADNFFLVFNY
jgi:hypothetical protein